MSIGQKSIAINREGYENFTPVENLDQMLMDTTQQANSSDKDIVIDSMNADISLDRENIYTDMNSAHLDIEHAVVPPTLPLIDSHTKGMSDSACNLHPDNEQDMIMPQTPTTNTYPTTHVETENLHQVNSSLDSSVDEDDKLSYHPTGTQLILPLKKRKPVVVNPLQTVLDIWRKDAVSRN